MENFHIKTRGTNKGTNAMMRAGIDLREFEGQDFFEAVKLKEILLKNNESNETILTKEVEVYRKGIIRCIDEL